MKDQLIWAAGLVAGQFIKGVILGAGALWGALLMWNLLGWMAK